MSTARLESMTGTSTDTLTETLRSKLSNPVTSPEFDLHGSVNEVLRDIGLTAADSGGKLTFYGQDPITPSPHRFGTMAALGLAAKSVALAALWKLRTGDDKTFMSTSGKLSGVSQVSSRGSSSRNGKQIGRAHV